MENNLSTEMELDYFLSEKKWFLVVSFLGKITKASGSILEKCQKEILQKGTSYVVLSLHDVDDILKDAIPSLVVLQDRIRGMPADLRLCFIRPEIRNALFESGAVRAKEIAHNLKDALQSFGNPRKE